MKVQHILYSGLGGHGSVFFSMVRGDNDNEFEYEGVFNGIEDIRNEYAQRCRSMNIPYIFIKKKPGEHLKFYYRILQAIRSSRPDIIFLHGSMSVAAAYFAKLTMSKRSRIVIRETQAMHLKSRPEKVAFKMGMKLADKIVFLSNEYAVEMQKIMGNSYKPDKISIIPNGIDLSLYYPLPGKAGSERLVFGMQSRLVAIKDHITLFKALAIIKSNSLFDFQMLVAGDGSFRDTLEREVDNAGLRNNIIFTGMLDEAALPSFLQSLDIYIHASLGETMSTAIMQAMACGLPVIASDVQGINNMITNMDNGILVPAKDEDAMAEAISRLAADAILKNKLSQNALSYAKTHFSNKRMFDEYKNLFNSFST